jgi:hypothetical protein
MKEKIKNLGWGSIVFLIIVFLTIDTSYSHNYKGTNYLWLMIGSSLFSFLVYHTIRDTFKKKYKDIYLSSILSGIIAWVITVVVVGQVT